MFDHDSPRPATSADDLRARLASVRRLADGSVERYERAANALVSVLDAQPDVGADGATASLHGAALVELGEARRRAGDVRGAFDALERAVRIATVVDDPSLRDEVLRWQGLAHHRLGIVHDTVGSASRAIAELRRALELFEAADDAASTGRVHNSLGIVYSRSGSYPEALERFAASLDDARRIGAIDRQAAVLSNLSITNRLLGRLDEAVAAALEAVTLCVDAELPDDQLGGAYTNLALAQAAAGDLDAARRSFDRGHAALTAAGDPFNLAEHLRCQGEFLLSQGAWEAALPLLEGSLALASSHAFEGLQAAAHEQLAAYWKACGDPAAALEHFERFHRHAIEQERATTAREREAQRLLTELAVARAEARAASREREALAAQYARLVDDHVDLTGRAAQLEVDALHDPLTGIANRRAFDRRLRAAFAHAAETGVPCSLLLIDADRFKRINDAYGHAAGDTILVSIAHALAAELRESDMAARLGGEEFAVLLPTTDRRHAVRVAEKLSHVIRTLAWPEVDPALRVSVSTGVASSSEGAATPQDLVALADQRLYHAKSTGRDRVEAGSASVGYGRSPGG